MASVIAKWQKCGKTACRCSEGMLHGPYFWLIAYVSKKSNDRRKGKYSWRYLGKNPTDVWGKLKEFDDRFNEKYDLPHLKNKIHKLRQIRQINNSFNKIENVLTVEDEKRS